ncbi:hypothetical protein LguiA_008378 [Lonicera macranthoides]
MIAAIAFICEFWLVDEGWDQRERSLRRSLSRELSKPSKWKGEAEERERLGRRREKRKRRIFADEIMKDGSTDVGVLGICGMGGIGKTTIAKYVYNQNCESFGGSSFLANIREMYEQPNGLVGLQRQLLSDILRRKQEKISNVDEGITKIKNALGCKRVLLVFDDVDQIDQLYAVYRVEQLDYFESLMLFSLHAFGKECPPKSYMEQTKRVIELCAGLPLALQVLGSSLSRKGIDEWGNEVKKLQEIPHYKILEKLKISYNTIQDDYDKRLFLHIACFFVGEDKDVIVKILQKCNLHAAVGIENLINRCLLTIDSLNKLRMHQLIRDMGREIVHKESHDEPGKRSRLWLHEDSFNVLKTKTGTKKIEGLTLDMMILKQKYEEHEKLLLSNKITSSKQHIFSLLFGQSISSTCEVELSTDAFQKMKNLRLLKLNHLLGSLKILNLSYSEGLKRTPNFSGSCYLERLILKGCVSLVEISETIDCLGDLVLLDLKDCKSLRKLPRNIHMLRSIETLAISGCSNLVEFPTNMRNMPSLQLLHADGIAINALSTTGSQGRLWHAIFRSWVSIPRIGPQTFLNYLPRTLVNSSLIRCGLYEDSFPSAFGNLQLLTELDLSNNFFGTLPDSIGSLSNLKRLIILSCRRLHSILGLPCSLEYVYMGSCYAVKKVSFQSAQTRIAEIRSEYCEDMDEIEGIFKIEPLGLVDEKIINSMGIDKESMKNIKMPFRDLYNTRMRPIQGPHEFGIFNTFISGGRVPSCFIDKSKGSSISFTVPSLPNLRIRCLNVFCVYYSPIGRLEQPILFAKIYNRTKDLTWIYSPLCVGFPYEDYGMAWLSQWNFGNDQLEGGDEVTVSIYTGNAFKFYPTFPIVFVGLIAGRIRSAEGVVYCIPQLVLILQIGLQRPHSAHKL